jgi:uncharacterized UPF0160 family protein
MGVVEGGRNILLLTPPLQMPSKKTIGTHSGSFHCDEALACYLLKLTDTYKDADIIRSRDPKVLDTLDIIVDVGGN